MNFVTQKNASKEGYKTNKQIFATPSSIKDMDNKEEERTILEGENLYHKEKGEPERIDHGSCIYPPYRKMLNKSKAEQKKAFLNYLVFGSHLDAIKLSEQFSNEDLEEILCQNDVMSSKIANWKNLKSSSECFLQLLLALIKERKLNINFSAPRWNNLYAFCLINIQTNDQFIMLQEFKNDINPKKVSIDLSNKENRTVNIIKLVLEAGAFEILKNQDQYDQTALSWAIGNGFEDLALEISQKIPESILVDLLKMHHSVFKTTPLFKAIDKDFKKLAFIMVRKISKITDLVDILKIVDCHNRTVIHFALSTFFGNKFEDLATEILNEVPTKDLVNILKIQDEYNKQTILHLAAISGSKNLVLKILEKISKADLVDILKIKDINGRSALESAMAHEFEDLALEIKKSLSDQIELV